MSGRHDWVKAAEARYQARKRYVLWPQMTTGAMVVVDLKGARQVVSVIANQGDSLLVQDTGGEVHEVHRYAVHGLVNGTGDEERERSWLGVPIERLERKLRELGRIRMGKRGGAKNQPMKLDTWRLTSPNEALLQVAADLYGGEVEPWDSPAGAQHQLTTTTDTLDAIVPPGEMLSQWFEMWSGGGCVRRCDGNFEQMSDGPCLCPSDDAERVELARDGKACRMTTRLGLMLPRLPEVGLWRLDTGGFYAATELAGAYDICNLATSQGRMVAVNLRLEQRMAKAGGKTHRYGVPVLDLGVTITDLMAQLGGTDGLVAPPPAPALEAPRQDAAVIAGPVQATGMVERGAVVTGAGVAVAAAPAPPAEVAGHGYVGDGDGPCVYQVAPGTACGWLREGHQP